MKETCPEVLCEKNPGHGSFIPVKDFSTGHLPEQHHSTGNYVVDAVRYLSPLISRICVTGVSNDRRNSYPFSQWRGRNVTRYATGLVTDVTDGENETICPCKDCTTSKAPKKKWGKISIITASHVVFDDSEAKTTTVDFFYDEISSKTVKLLCESLIDSDVQTGASAILCITHNKLALNKLKHSLGNFRQFLLRDVKSYQEFQPGLAVIVSHPHGCSKHVTVGTWTSTSSRKRKITDARAKFNYDYNVPTCPGSSGAPVFVFANQLAQSWESFFSHPHCGELRKRDKRRRKNYCTSFSGRFTEKVNSGMTRCRHSSGDIMSYEADIVSVEARVIYPLGEVKVCSIWFNKRTVKQEKERLLNESDVEYGHPDTFVLTVVSGQDQHTVIVLVDEDLTSHYIEYLAAENSLKIVKREEAQNFSGYGVSVKPSWSSS